MSRRLLFDMLENTDDVSSKFLSQFTQTAKESDNPKRLSTFINPSSLKCIRQACFKGLGYTPDDIDRSLNLIAITSVGSYLHEFTQGILTKMPDWQYIDVAKFVEASSSTIDKNKIVVLGKSGFETKLESQTYNIHFLVDGIMEYQKQNYLIEIKSMTSKKYYQLQDLGEYKVQIVSYATLLGLNKGLLIAVDRDLLNYKVIPFSVSRVDKFEWQRMMHTLLNHIKEKTVPPIPANIEKSTCAYCPYRGVCNSLE